MFEKVKKLLLSLQHEIFGHPRNKITWGDTIEGAECRCGFKFYLSDLYPGMLLFKNMKNQVVYCGDMVEVLKKFPENYFDVIVTSPPYNLRVKYMSYGDNKDYTEYLKWTEIWIEAVKRVMKVEGSFFLNVGNSPANPWISHDVSSIARKHFILQNRIYWVKSISIDNTSHGHYKPVNSKRFMHDAVEYIFHFTFNGNIAIDRLSNGVPYKHKSNVTRWNRPEKIDKRCRGNAWYIPYETRTKSAYHPATYPVKLPEMCIKLHGLRNDLVVLDPFVGSGSTIYACENLGVEGVGIDIDKNYTQKIKEKLTYFLSN